MSSHMTQQQEYPFDDEEAASTQAVESPHAITPSAMGTSAAPTLPAPAATPVPAATAAPASPAPAATPAATPAPTSPEAAVTPAPSKENAATPGTSKSKIESLVRRASRGNREALLSLCRAIARDVLFRVSYRLPDRREAEDVAQEVLIRVCANIRTLKDPKAFGGWLHSIIMNETNRYVRTEAKTSPILDIQDYIETAEEQDEDFLPQEYILAQEDRESVMRIIKSLPDRQQEAIMLHYYEGMNVVETARVMGIAHPAVSRYLALAREKIKIEFERYSAEAGGKTALGSLAGLPIGALIAQAFNQESGWLTGADNAWLNQAVGRCSAYTKGAGSASGGFAHFTAAAVTLLVATLAVFGIWVFTANNGADETDEAALGTLTGTVVFSGGTASEAPYMYRNPTHASVQTSGAQGGLTVLGWKITTPDEATVLFSGEGANADGALAELQAQGADGEYQIAFSLSDGSGATYTLKHGFLIRSEAPIGESPA